MTNQTISNLEAHLTPEEVIEVRTQSLRECTVEGAVEKGIPYIADLMRIYRHNLVNKYYEKSDEGLG